MDLESKLGPLDDKQVNQHVESDNSTGHVLQRGAFARYVMSNEFIVVSGCKEYMSRKTPSQVSHLTFFRFAERRKLEAERIRSSHPNDVPVILERADPCLLTGTVDRRKYLVPCGLTVAQFYFTIRKKQPNLKKNFVLMCGTSILPKGKLMSAVYEEQKDPEDSFLYINYSEATREGGHELMIGAICAAMKRNLMNAEVQETGCNLLCHLATTKSNSARTSSNDVNDDNEDVDQGVNNTTADLIAGSGAIQDVCLAMETHTTDGAVQKQACELFSQLARDHAEHRKLIAWDGGIEAVIGGMRRNLEDSALLQTACETLRHLAFENDANKKLIAGMGGIDVVCRAMQIHNTNATVQMQGCQTLVSCLLDGGMTEMDEALLDFVFETIRSATASLPDNDMVQKVAEDSIQSLVKTRCFSAE